MKDPHRYTGTFRELALEIQRNTSRLDRLEARLEGEDPEPSDDEGQENGDEDEGDEDGGDR